MLTEIRSSRSTRRREQRWRVVRWVVLVGALAGGVYLAYEAGLNLGQHRIAELETEVDRLTDAETRLQRENTRLEAVAQTARMHADGWRQRYEQEIPSSAQQQLMALLERQLDAGVDRERLVLMIEAAGASAECRGEPVSRRFMVRTPLQQGANDSVSFAGNAITVTARGPSAVDENGNPEAWFDADRPVEVQFTALGGAQAEAAGPLPLHHSMRLSDAEYRFTVVAGESRGFVMVTADRCELPEASAQAARER